MLQIMGTVQQASKISAARVAALGGVQTCVASGYDLGNIKKVLHHPLATLPSLLASLPPSFPLPAPPPPCSAPHSRLKM